jgi:hypothetical protein
MASTLTAAAPKIFEKIDEKAKKWGVMVSCIVSDYKGEIVAKHLTKGAPKILYTTGYGKVRAIVSGKGWTPSNMRSPFEPIMLCHTTCCSLPALFCCGSTFPLKGSLYLIYKDDDGKEQHGIVTVSGCVFAYNDVKVARYALEELGCTKSQEDSYEYVWNSST